MAKQGMLLNSSMHLRTVDIVISIIVEVYLAVFWHNYHPSVRHLGWTLSEAERLSLLFWLADFAWKADYA